MAISDANAKEAATIRITSIPMMVGSKGHDGLALRGRTISTLNEIPIEWLRSVDDRPRNQTALTAVTNTGPARPTDRDVRTPRHGGGLGEEELEGGGEFGEGVEGEDEWLGEGGGDPFERAGLVCEEHPELDRADSLAYSVRVRVPLAASG
jgi:hypothetical protein